MLSRSDVELLWEVMSRCDDDNSAKIARIIRDDLNVNYINKKSPQKKKISIDPRGHDWLRLQSKEIRETAEDFGEWLAENSHDKSLPEFEKGNKIPLIKRFRTLSESYFGTLCGLKDAKDCVEIVFGNYVINY